MSEEQAGTDESAEDLTVPAEQAESVTGGVMPKLVAEGLLTEEGGQKPTEEGGSKPTIKDIGRTPFA